MLRGGMHDAMARQLAAEGRVLQLRKLGLRDDDLVGLNDAAELRRITALDVADNELTDAGLEHIANCRHFSALRSLIVDFNDLTSAAGRVVGQSPHLASLRELSLNDNALGDEGIVALAQSGVLRSVESLALGHCGFGIGGLHALLTAPSVCNLRALDIRGAPVDAAIIELCIESESLKSLEVIDFSDNALGPDAIGERELERLVGATRSLSSLRKVTFLPERIWGDSGELDVTQWRAKKV